MLNFARLSRLTACITVFLFLLSAPLLADTIYSATLDGATAGSASTATGTAVFILNTARTEVSYVVDYTVLGSAETGAHIHNGAPGVPGPRFHTFSFGTPKTGVWQVGEFEVGELENGRVYVNIHSFDYPGGELRGDLSFTSVGNDGTSWGAVKVLFR